MKKIFVYYSLTGNGDAVSEILKKKGYEVLKVEPKKPLPKRFIFRIISGGFRARLNLKDEIKDLNVNFDDYDEIIIGSPIWNGRISCPINTVLDKYDFKNKNISFIFYSGSGESFKASKKVKEMYNDVKIINLKEPLKGVNELKKLDF